MTIQEMHIVFRTLGQQMGLQRIRTILPESIDIYLNDAIMEWTRKRVAANVDSVYNDRITMQRNGISPINGVRTLYKQANIAVGAVGINNNYITNLNSIENVMFYTSFDVNYKSDNNYYNCRIVEREKLYYTLSDYCNAASKEYPVLTMLSDDTDTDIVELYIGNENEPDMFLVHYIANPDKVVYNVDTTLSTNCNLPEYCHNEIVELAVNKFFQSVGATNQNVSAQ